MDNCFYCGIELTKEQQEYNVKNAEYCCSGLGCMCMGMPLDPPSCNKQECIDNYNNKLRRKLNE